MNDKQKAACLAVGTFFYGINAPTYVPDYLALQSIAEVCHNLRMRGKLTDREIVRLRIMMSDLYRYIKGLPYPEDEMLPRYYALIDDKTTPPVQGD